APVGAETWRAGLDEIGDVGAGPLPRGRVPPHHLLALRPRLSLGVGGRAVVQRAAVGRPGERPAEMAARPARAVRLARTSDVVAVLGIDAGVHPAAASGRAVVLELL